MMSRASLVLVLLAFTMAPVSTARGAAASDRVPLWNRYEARLEADTDLKEPLHQVDVSVELTSPSGKAHSVGAFWDGFRIWLFRFAPDEPGRWTWRSRATPVTAGLHERTGAFQAMPYTGKNPLYRRGALRVAADRRHLTYADGTPFFWLADTAWNGVMKADAKSWDSYLRDRLGKGFNVIQYVTTQWRTAAGNADARPAFYGTDRISIDPVFFQWMDERVDAINEARLGGRPGAHLGHRGLHRHAESRQRPARRPSDCVGPLHGGPLRRPPRRLVPGR